MDILKVLSRGLKQPNGGKNANANNNFLPAGATTLPSAGSSVNPQLYHDKIASVNKKRKRGGAATSDAENSGDGSGSDASGDESDDMSELDFFGEKTTATDTPKKSKKSESSDDKDKKSKATKKQKRDLASELLDEDACKQILRSHRLKLTLLVDRKAAAEAAAAEAKKSDKKDKKEKKSKKAKRAEEEAAAAAAKASKDDAKKQLYAQPLTSFSQLRPMYNLSPRLADNLERLLYRIPTEVQMGSLPLLLDPALALSKTTLPGGVTADASSTTAVDFMAVAPTGSGKTLSFLVPAINGILKRRAEDKEKEGGDSTAEKEVRSKHDHVLDTIVVAPTRELAHQIASEGKKLTVGTGVRVVAMSKGMRVQEDGDEAEESEEEKEHEEDEDEDDDDDNDDEDKPKAGKATVTRADILVTTPLMLLNSLTRGQRALPTVRSLILDEADVLLDPLFRDQTMGIWTACTHRDLRATFWSATMASNVEELVMGTLAARQKDSLSLSTTKRLLIRLVVGLKDTAVPNVTHRLVYTATEQGKLLAMRQLLHPSTSVSVTGSGSTGESEALRPPFLVFTQTAERATALHDELKYDIPAAAGGADRLGVLHAALADSARSAVVRKFRAGQIWVLITTDVLARGIDFAGVNGVVNYDVPGSAAAYVHRAGRTGRAGRQGGLSVTLYTKEDIPFVKSVANVIAASEKQAGKGAVAEGKGIQQWLLDALPEVTKKDKKRLKTRGVESRRSTTTAAAADKNKGKGGRPSSSHSKNKRDGKETVPNAKARITSKSAWERRRDNNRRDAIASSKQRKQKEGDNDEGEWGGLE
ncbi:RNA-dependent ATPase rok1 [Sporothrix bragantina]|uniref:ATP-dependent RNA helicase ROK1 n=1 Tax=Sporothrix bragantina TaxID=671064 RepID=A0ABP0B782_9PEZI